MHYVARNSTNNDLGIFRALPLGLWALQTNAHVPWLTNV